MKGAISMATKTILDYTAAVSIDPTNDYFLLEQSGVYKRINRLVMLGITGSPVGTSDSQTLTNKSIANTNTLTIKDGSFTIQNTSDTTKQVVFSAAGVTTGTTRTITLPNATSTLATLAGTETLTNKSITGATLSGGTIDNATITVDSISGHTTSTLVTVGGIQLNNGVITTANAVTATSIAVGAVQPQALVTGTGTGWAWSSWIPTWTNVTTGNGVVVATYIQIGKTVSFKLRFTLGSSSSVGSGNTNFTLPVTATTNIGTQFVPIYGGSSYFNASTGAVFQGSVAYDSSTTAALQSILASGTYTNYDSVNSSKPFAEAFATGDIIYAGGSYEAA